MTLERKRVRVRTAGGLYITKTVEEEPLAKTVHARVTRAEWMALQRMALARGESITDILRKKIRDLLTGSA